MSNEPKKEATGYDFLRAAADQATKAGAYTAGEARSVLNVIDFLEKNQEELAKELQYAKDEAESLRIALEKEEEKALTSTARKPKETPAATPA